MHVFEVLYWWILACHLTLSSFNFEQTLRVTKIPETLSVESLMSRLCNMYQQWNCIWQKLILIWETIFQKTIDYFCTKTPSQMFERALGTLLDFPFSYKFSESHGTAKDGDFQGLSVINWTWRVFYYKVFFEYWMVSKLIKTP